ncbi:formylglycine-generating enzyme family protein [Pseudaestuariivita rosea]|uniref:formylglycine-generating enzyme family protein n=1 Tax=Pseudaestuariivita rosea TaxID=2763263 RepID=UPI00234FDCDD|nr:formylglycine-generating enzyme family protein [Pseudaestuariivita rosea]
MIELPMGDFIMGAYEDELRSKVGWRGGKLVPVEPEERIRNTPGEGPQHKVKVDIPIAMGRNEVTYDEWMACVDDGGCGGVVPQQYTLGAGKIEEVLRSLNDPTLSRFASEENIAKALQNRRRLPLSGRYPVMYVSVLDAKAYTDWLNQKLDTDAYRLPTEAEWEYAARAGTTTRFAQGDEITSDQANFNGEATEYELQENRPDLRTRGYPVLVDELDAANPWGLRHMSGNIGEMTLSCYTRRYQGWSTTSEWLEKSVRDSCERVMRGGNYIFDMDAARVARRIGRDETYATNFYGFRVVKELD